MNKICLLLAASAAEFVLPQAASAATYEAIYKGYTEIDSTTVSAEADFFYDLDFGTITNSTFTYPLSSGGSGTLSSFAGQTYEESARLTLGTLGTYYFGSETSFSGNYVHFTDLGNSAANFSISGLDGTLSGSFFAAGATTIPATIMSGIPLTYAMSAESDYSVSNGPSGSFLTTSIEVIAPSPVPLPRAAPLFAIALFALGLLGPARKAAFPFI